MEKHEHITAHPGILGGKPIVRGTRLGVAFLLDLVAAGWTEEQLLENYPTLTPESLLSVLGAAADARMGRQPESHGR